MYNGDTCTACFNYKPFGTYNTTYVFITSLDFHVDVGYVYIFIKAEDDVSAERNNFTCKAIKKSGVTMFFVITQILNLHENILLECMN